LDFYAIKDDKEYLIEVNTNARVYCLKYA